MGNCSLQLQDRSVCPNNLVAIVPMEKAIRTKVNHKLHQEALTIAPDGAEAYLGSL